MYTRYEIKEGLHKVAKKPGRGVRLTSQSRSIVEHVRQFFERENEYGHNILQDECT